MGQSRWLKIEFSTLNFCLFALLNHLENVQYYLLEKLTGKILWNITLETWLILKFILKTYFNLRYWSGSLKLPHEQPFSQFVDNLGPGQKVSRQVLGSPYLGEIRLILFEEESKLSITIIEAKNLKDSRSFNHVPCKFKISYYHILMIC